MLGRSLVRWLYLRRPHQLLWMLLLQLHVVGHQTIGIVPELFRNLVTDLANPFDLLVAFIYLKFFTHRTHLIAPWVSPTPAHTSQEACSPGECARTCWRSPSADNSMLPETHTCGTRPMRGEAHLLQDPRA